jgi:hypothetical protein
VRTLSGNIIDLLHSDPLALVSHNLNQYPVGIMIYHLSRSTTNRNTFLEQELDEAARIKQETSAVDLAIKKDIKSKQL